LTVLKLCEKRRLYDWRLYSEFYYDLEFVNLVFRHEIWNETSMWEISVTIKVNQALQSIFELLDTNTMKYKKERELRYIVQKPVHYIYTYSTIIWQQNYAELSNMLFRVILCFLMWRNTSITLSAALDNSSRNCAQFSVSELRLLVVGFLLATPEFTPRAVYVEVLMDVLALGPITVVAWSKAWTVFARSNTGIVGSNPTRGVDICVLLFRVCAILCAGSCLATGWSPIRGVLPSA
jgi:hypothetical protein